MGSRSEIYVVLLVCQCLIECTFVYSVRYSTRIVVIDICFSNSLICVLD